MEPVQAIQPSGWIKDGGNNLSAEKEYRRSGPVRRIVSNRGPRRKTIVAEIRLVHLEGERNRILHRPYRTLYPMTNQ